MSVPPPRPPPPPPRVVQQESRSSMPNEAAPPLPVGTVAGVELLDLRETLAKFYAQHCPEKIEKIDIALDMYRGDESQLLKDLMERYQVSEAQMVQFYVAREGIRPSKPSKPSKPSPVGVLSASRAATAVPSESSDDDDEEDQMERSLSASRNSQVPPIRIGNLTKVRVKDGALQNLFFVLKQEGLFYVKKKPLDGMFKFLSRLTGLDLGTSTMIERNTRNIDILKLMASELGSADQEAVQRTASLQDINLDCIFILRSKLKSFYLIAPSASERLGWLNDIEQARKTAQLLPENGNRLTTEEEMCPLYTFKSEVSECTQCGRSFGVFARRHHCRQCGIVVCETCSRNKVRIPKLDERILFKCCNACTTQLKKERRYGAASVI